MKTSNLALIVMLAGVASCQPTSLSSSDKSAAESPVAWPKIISEVRKNPEIEHKVSELLSQMTLEQKVAQMIQPEIRDITIDDMRRYGFGSYLNGGGSFPNGDKNAPLSAWVALADEMFLASVDDSLDGSSIPTLWGTDAVHGHNNLIGATLFPHNIGLGAMHNPALVEQIAQATALEVRASGIDWAFAPTVATARDDRWGRTYESYSESPSLVKDYARAVVYGIQGRPNTGTFLNDNHVLSSVKHFIGDGGTFDGDDQGDNRDNEQNLRDIHAQGYISSLEAGAQIVMASFNSWHGKKVHGSHYLLTEVLKNQMGFDGFVVGDWAGHGQVAGCTNESCPQAINAGLDMFMAPTKAWKPLLANTIEQVKAGIIPMARIDDAVTRILTVKARFGLFDLPRPSARQHANNSELLGTQAHRDLARQAVRESLVLLKDNTGLLPLSPSQTVLVAGDGANNVAKQSGGWTITWQGTNNQNSDFPGATSILDGIKAQVEKSKGTVIYSENGDVDQPVDVAIVVFGEDPYAEGHGDRTNLDYQPGEKTDLALLQQLQAKGTPTVSVFISGRPLWVNPEINASDAFVAAWLPGSEGGGVADVLFRDEAGEIRYPFTGTLSFSWPNSPYDHINDGDGQTPLFPLGYGLKSANASVSVPQLNEVIEPIQLDALNRVLFDGKMHRPWHIRLNDNGQSLEVQSNTAQQGGLSYRSSDRFIQEDAMRVTFTGGTEQALVFNSKSSFREDLRTDLLNHGALTFSINLHQTPSESILVTTRCDGDSKPNCGASLPLPLTQMAPEQWYRVTMPLHCFAQLGMEFQHTVVPFSLVTQGIADLSINAVEIELHTAQNDSCTSIIAE